MTVKEAVEALSQAIKDDSDLAWGWHSNIAACYMDEGATHERANWAAYRFMSTAFGVDMTQNPNWPY